MQNSTSVSREDIRQIAAVLRTVVRAYRAGQMYLPNSPMLPKAIDDAREALRSHWEKGASLSLAVSERALLVDTQAVYLEEERSSTALPWLLYRDGIRELVLQEGFEATELDRFLDILHVARTATSDDDDVVTLLWVANFQYLRFRHVDWSPDLDATLVDGDLFDGSEAGAVSQPPASHFVEATPPGEGPPPVILRLDEEDASLMALDPVEQRALQAAIRQEYATDRLPAVVDCLFDLIELQSEPDIRDEICDLLDGLVATSLERNEYAAVARVVRGIRLLAARQVEMHAEAQRALDAIVTTVQSPGVVSHLLEWAVRGGGETLDTVGELHDGAGVDTMIAVLTWMEVATAVPLRTGIVKLVTTQLAARPTVLRRLLEHASATVVRGAVQLAREVASPSLVPPLSRLFREGPLDVRGDAALALAAIATPGAMEHLLGAITHEVRDVRLAVYKAVAATRYRPAFPALLQEIGEKTLRKYDLTEKRGYVEALVAAGGDDAIKTLDGLLNGRSLLGYRESSEMRACAAFGLGLVGTSASGACLQRAADTTDPLVKRAVSQAMRGDK